MSSSTRNLSLPRVVLCVNVSNSVWCEGHYVYWKMSCENLFKLRRRKDYYYASRILAQYRKPCISFVHISADRWTYWKKNTVTTMWNLKQPMKRHLKQNRDIHSTFQQHVLDGYNTVAKLQELVILFHLNLFIRVAFV